MQIIFAIYGPGNKNLCFVINTLPFTPPRLPPLTFPASGEGGAIEQRRGAGGAIGHVEGDLDNDWLVRGPGAVIEAAASRGVETTRRHPQQDGRETGQNSPFFIHFRFHEIIGH